MQKLFAIFKTFGLFHGLRKILFTSIYKRLTDSFMADHAYAKSSFRYLTEFYKRHDAQFDILRPALKNDVTETDFVFWTCWLQGLEAAPDLVKACVNSARKHAAGCRVIVITYDNLETYITLPSFIIEKHKQGSIQQPHFADILRTYLLYTYGGVWFDATVFFTRDIPGELITEPLFFFRSPLDDKYCPVSNWFIIAGEKGSPLLFKQLCALFEYWRLHNTLIDYFIFHYFLQIIINSNPDSAAIFGKIPYRNNQNPHYLQLELLCTEFDAELWEKAKNVSFCHKLTYKTPQDIIKKSFYNFITQGAIDDQTAI
jgi:hypothetical protein